MLNRSKYPLYNRLAKANEMIENAQTDDDFLALGNYIGNMYRLLVSMGENISVDPISCFGSKPKFKKFLKNFDIYSDSLIHNFVLKKDFHSAYLEDILPIVEKEWDEVSQMDSLLEERLSKKQFCEILYAFLESINMMDLLQELLYKKSIHSTPNRMNDYLGLTIFNPLNGDIDILVGDFKYTINHMNTLVHELGHGYDLKNFHGAAKDYNRYFYLSYYGEVLSRLMERLLHHFLIKNGLIPNSAKMSLIDFEDMNHDFLLQGYILSLLDSSFLLSNGFSKCNSKVLTKMIKKHFIEESKLEEYLDDINNNFDILDVFSYIYGDVISLFLCNEIERVGMNNDLLEEFMKHRTELFQEIFLQKNGLNPNGYNKLYKKEIELLKK